MIPQFHSGFILSLTPMPLGKTGAELVPGDRMHNKLGGIIARPTILENSPSAFRWRGPWPYTYLNLLCGWHTFRFEPSKTNPGHTLFVHEETFTGPLAWVMGLETPNRKTMVKFYKYNTDFRAWLEDGVMNGEGANAEDGEGMSDHVGESLSKDKPVPLITIKEVKKMP
jgi:hypothetical protein